MDGLLLPVGGFMCGLLAGLAAQYGRLCTIGAIEDALVAGDLRRTRAWALAAAVAMLLTQALVFSGQLDLAATHYVQSRLDRPVRSWLADLAVIDTAPFGGKTMTGIVAAYLGQPAAVLCAFGVPVGLLAFGLASERLHRRPRLVAASCAMGLAVAAGWLATGVLGDPFSGQRPESLTFVAPLARLILQIMGEALSSTGFAVATVLGVAAGSFAAAALRGSCAGRRSTMHARCAGICLAPP